MKQLKVAAFFFLILAVVHLLIGIVDYFLVEKLILRITYPYLIILAAAAFISSVLYAFTKNWIRTAIVFLGGVISCIFLIYLATVARPSSMSVYKQLPNTNYYIDASLHMYIVYKKKLWHDRVIATKSSSVFFMKYSKIGLDYFVEPTLISEDDKSLTIKFSKKNVTEVIQKK